MDDEKKGFVFLRSYYLAIKELPDAQRLEVYDAMCKYALDGVMPEDLSVVAKAIIQLVRPTIDTSIRKYQQRIEAGKRSAEARRERNANESATNSERTSNEQSTNGQQDKEKDKDKDKDKEKDKDKDMEKETLPPKSPQGDGEKEPSLQERRFEDFWQAYPKKKAKDAARRAWKKISPSKELCATIVESVSEHIARDPNWKKDNGQFIPHPATYLNDGGWQDELAKAPEADCDDYDPNDPYKYWN